ncbi:MAG: FabA-like domain protein [Verrucomicrobia bacterium]|nr:FabA-like domain protein [Verrucomicrobiota bacterium]
MTKQSDPTVEEDLKELLKRCPVGTYEAALSFRKDKDISQVETIVLGIIDRHLEPEQREILADSETMLEVVMLVEQTLEVSIDNEELRDLRTIGDVKAYLNAKAKGEEPPKRMKTYRVEEIASLMPHKEPFMFLESATIAGDTATARYKISGNEYFLEGHFKENPVFPASIMIEALGQLCVFFLLKGENEALVEKVNPNTIYFTSCDGVKCRRICKPGDTLEMQVKVNRIRHPLASFQGEITVEGQKTSTAEEVKLAFDYYPVIDGEVSTTAEMRGHNSSNGNGSHPKKPKVSNKEEVSPRFVKFSSNS